jgi:hypothetical protein
MSDDIPPSWFRNQETKTDDADAAIRRRRLLKELPALLEGQKDRGRARKFEPYLLIRSVLGDRGDRPINVPFWESPDIWIAPGAPAASPAVPASHGGTATVGTPNTLYAHVWNLGFAPLAGVRVEFFWFNPSLSIDGAHAHPIGNAVCELSGRGMAGSHKLVKCSKPWVPVMENGGHECLIARVSGLGDPIGGNEWSPWFNRHVAQRNVSVVTAGSPGVNLIRSLTASRLITGHLQLIQLGPNEGRLAAQIAAPHLRVSPKVTTHLLGEITALGDVTLRQPLSVPSGMLAPIHALAHGVSNPAPVMRDAGAVSVIDPGNVFGEVRSVASAPNAGNHVADLFAAVGRFQRGGKALAGPPAGEAYVLRMATYSGTQLVGGYTLVMQK